MSELHALVVVIAGVAGLVASLLLMRAGFNRLRNLLEGWNHWGPS